MDQRFSYHKVPPSRFATFDVFAIGLQKHHVSALIEFDVTDSREKLKALRRKGIKASFNAWMIKAISDAVERHPEAAAYVQGRDKLMVFNDINIAFLVEKNIDDEKVPIPLVIERTNQKSIGEITEEIEKAKSQVLSGKDVVLRKKPKLHERLYYHLPGILRRAIWKFMLRHPKVAFGKMGNVAITSLGMVGRINGWFIHKSVHPLSFGMGSVVKKPVVVGDEIKIREILNMTILFDHDVIDGAPMVRLLNDLTKFVESGGSLDEYGRAIPRGRQGAED
ncbi:MAG: 2-oxo acid dehydrogenase subunit E2 [Bacteroidetes bacterium]|nr:2-oxo acid dehydrogenase subunit E2 [Bacteroidota bacterium]